MKHVDTTAHHRFFAPVLASASAQAAVMVLPPGQSSSARPENEHPAAEQWLFVVSGSGSATVAGRSVDLTAGSLLLIERGEPHQITAAAPLVTVNLYCPPAYTGGGDVTVAAR